MRSRSSWRILLLLAVACAAGAAFSCKREERDFRVQPPAAQTAEFALTTELHAGGPATQSSGHVFNEYEQNAQALSEGKRLYENFNCVGCHAHGGGDKGPALMDDKWIYGSAPEQIFATIIQGRPNGMPSFRGRIPDYQVWQLVAYVRSLSGLVNKNAAPGRSDHMQTKPAEQSMPMQPPTSAASPSGSP